MKRIINVTKLNEYTQVEEGDVFVADDVTIGIARNSHEVAKFLLSFDGIISKRACDACIFDKSQLICTYLKCKNVVVVNEVLNSMIDRDKSTINRNNSNLLSTKVTGYSIKFKICNSDFCPFYGTNCKNGSMLNDGSPSCILYKILS